MAVRQPAARTLAPQASEVGLSENLWKDSPAVQTYILATPPAGPRRESQTPSEHPEHTAVVPAHEVQVVGPGGVRARGHPR